MKRRAWGQNGIVAVTELREGKDPKLSFNIYLFR